MRVLLVSIALFLAKTSVSQTWELGLSMGGANYLGDLAPSLAMGETGLMTGFTVKKNYSGYFSLSGSLTYGRISGNDQNFSANAPRNLQFRSNLFETSFLYEFNFQKYVIGLRAKTFSPYVFTGLAFTYHNPQGQFDGTWYNLRSLSTEGQGFGGNSNYSNFLFALPMGGGLKWQISGRINTATFIGYRYTFTDYLDDVGGVYYDNESLNQANGPAASYLADPADIKSPAGKQRGNANDNDWYLFAGFSITYILDDPNCPNPAGNRRR